MDFTSNRITKAVKRYDYLLFCKRNIEGKQCIYRQGKLLESYMLDDSKVLYNVKSTPNFIFALTHNWKESGYTVDWGIEPILARLKAIDLWKRDLADECEKNEEKHIESLARERKNTTESFLYEFRDKFKKTFSDVNTANMNKKIKKKEY